MQQDGEH